MKRQALALALLLLTATAEARVMVIKSPNDAANASGVNHARMNGHERVLELLRTSGVDFDVYRAEGVQTEWARMGRFVRSPGDTIQYDAVIFNGWRAQTWSTSSGYIYPDSLLVIDKWPTVPTLFLGLSGTQGAADMASHARCTTGVASNNAHATAYFEDEDWLVGTDIRWKGWESNQYMVRSATVPLDGTDAVFRPIVGVGKSYQYAAYAAGAHIKENPADFDSISTPQSRTFPDTLAVWARYPASGNYPAAQRGGPRNKNIPVIFCKYGGSTGAQPYIRILMALAVLDSAAGGNVMNVRNKLPIKFAFQTSRWGGYNKIGYRSLDGTGGSNDYGIMCVSDSCDTSFVKATLDSLQRARIPMSFGVQTDSMATYATQMEWLRLRYPLAKVFPYNVGGTSTTAAADRVTNANAGSSVDTYGAVRLRRLLPAGASGTDPSAWDCTGDTASVYCNLRRAYDKLRAYFGESRLDRVAAAPLEDWTPTYFSRAGGDMDSLVWVLWSAGLRGIRVSNQSPGLTSAFGSSGTGAPRGGYTNLRVVDVKAPGSTTVLGKFVFIPSRDEEVDPSQFKGRVRQTAHDLSQEFLRGVFDGDWYHIGRGPLYTNNHEFMSRTLIMEFSASSLGGRGRANPARLAWWYPKWINNQCRAVNRLAGRTIISPGYGDEVVEYVLRSGVR